MERIACIPVEFGENLYEFKLYARTLLVIGDKVKIEYTEKICNAETCTFFDEYPNNKDLIEAGMKKEAREFQERTLRAIASWDAKPIEGENDV